MTKPCINGTTFGTITISDETYEHDVVIRLNGQVDKRKKKLSKAYGSSHIVSLDEAKFIFEPGAKHIIIGSGQSGCLDLSAEAEAFFQKKGCRIQLLPTPQAIDLWNRTQESAIGLFHVTC